MGTLIYEVYLRQQVTCVLGGGGGWCWVCKPILVFSLSLSQAEQKLDT